MALAFKSSIVPPYRDKIAMITGELSASWQGFIRAAVERLEAIIALVNTIQSAVDPLGTEQAFTLTPHASATYPVTGLVFDHTKTTFAIIDFIVQRVSGGSGATEKNEMGTLYARYNPRAATWTLGKLSPTNPGTSDVVFTINNSGQIISQTPVMAGTHVFSRMHWRARTMAAPITEAPSSWA